MESRVGEGSVFRFSIQTPISARQELDVEPELFPIGYKGERHRILVVDDVPSNRQILLDVLKPLGFELKEAANGRAALKIIEKWRPDLMIIDLVMPIMGGLETIRALRKDTKLADIRIIVASANAQPGDEQESLAAGADSFTTKPIVQGALIKAIGALLNLEWQFHLPAMVNRAKDSADIQPPPMQELRELHEYALTGDMRSIREYADHIHSLGPEYAGFAMKLRELADGFQSKAIVSLVERYLGREHR